MKKNNEMESQDLRVDNDIQVSEDGHSIIAYLETWFDVERKFGVDLSAEDAWLNLNAMYDPFADKLVTVRRRYTWVCVRSAGRHISR